MTPIRALGLVMAGGVGVLAIVTAPSETTIATIVTAAVFVAASAVTVGSTRGPRSTPSVGLVVTAGSAVILTQLDPTAVPLALFLVGAMAPLAMPAWVGSAVAVFSVAVYTTLELVHARGSWTLVATGAGVLFFGLVGRLALAERAQRTRIAGLLADLEASRAMEAEAHREAARARMARDLHDVLAHTLSGLALHLETARLLAADERTDPALRGAVDTAHRLSRTGLDEARRAVRALRGDERPGIGSLDALVAEHRLATGAPCMLDVETVPESVPAEVQEALYRGAQEALSNIRRHAPGAGAHVRVEHRDGSIVLTVENEAARREIVPASDAGTGWGLAGMAERAHLLGGTVEAGPRGTDGAGGFRVHLSLPLPTVTP